MATYQSTSRYSLDASNMTATRVDASSSSYTQYVTGQGESFESLAAKLYNDGTRYWEIADLNPQVPYPDFIPVGTVIRLPR